jgi:gliding motility-associated lipoprotein GldH
MFPFTRKVSITIYFLFILLCFQSCDRDRFYEENKRIENNIWNNKEKAVFKVMLEDIHTSYSFYINIRNSTDYPYSNIFLFLETVFPDGKIARDTIECQLADYSGKWTGSGMSNIKFNRFLFQKGIRFPQQGQYIFEFEQAMRNPDLKGISDIGMRLEKN